MDDLQQFADYIQKWHAGCLNELGWTNDDISNFADQKVRCSINPQHWIARKVQPEHEKVCQLKLEGVDEEQLQKEKEEENILYFYRNSTFVRPLVIDDGTILAIANSCNANRENYSAAVLRRRPELGGPLFRLKLYEYAQQLVYNDKALSEADLLLLPSQEGASNSSKPKSHLQILAELRDQKRRRQTYRGKNYSAKKSQTQIIKELIDSQMELLGEVDTGETGNALAESKPAESKPTESKPESKPTARSPSEQREPKTHKHHSKAKRKRSSRSPSSHKHKHKKHKHSRVERNDEEKHKHLRVEHSDEEKHKAE